MLALTSTVVAGDLRAVVERNRGWTVRQVPSVGAAAAAISARERDQVRALIVETEPVDADTMSGLVNLEVVVCPRSEPVNVDLAAADRLGVAVVHAPGRNAEAVADFTLGLCLAALRNIAIAHHGVVSGALTSEDGSRSTQIAKSDVIWRPHDPAALVPYLAYKGRELSSLAVGIVGYGAVGRAVAQRFNGLVRQVIVVDPRVPADCAAPGLVMMSLADMLPVADVVTLHARSNSTVLGRRELFMMKEGSYLINTARGTVLDYDALISAIDSGPLRGAALDVFPEEPLPYASALRTHARLTLTPHLAGATEEVTGRQYTIAAGGLDGIYALKSSWEQLPVRNPGVRELWLRRREVVHD
jgi:D-3-phosphoglycerate dehydrogenase / 2-oxoglutarate reductase